jgi:PHAX RNA-binding domain
MDTLTVETLAEILQEPKVPLLRQVLRTVGPDRCAALLADTLACEASGGMLTKDGTRRRTPGGVFLQLVKERATRQERHPVVAGDGTHVLLAQTCTSVVQQRAKKQAEHPPQGEATP